MHTRGKKKKVILKTSTWHHATWIQLKIAYAFFLTFELSWIKINTKKTLVKISIAVSLVGKQGLGNSVFTVYVYKPVYKLCESALGNICQG